MAISNVSDTELLAEIYAAFNARDIDSVLLKMDPDVDWPNGWEGGRIHGRDQVRDYWTRQWQAIDPRVEPQGFATEPDGRTVVDVHQIVRDLAGNIVVDEMVQHVYQIKDGLIKSMEIRK